VSAQDVDVQQLGSRYEKELVQAANGIPGRVRIGDINADGFPDIMITVATGASNRTNVIMINKPVY